jgi:hypothetical protein
MDIRNQTGTIEQPLATLGDVLPDFTKNDLKKTTEAITAQASYGQRAQWWATKHPVKLVLGAAALGAVLSITLTAYLSNRD